MSDRLGIADLIDTYAVAVDRRDTALFASLWVKGSRMAVVYGRTGLGPPTEYRFPDEVGRFLTRLQRLDRSLHCVTTRRIVMAGEAAAGELYCDAHYVAGSMDLQMACRYDDRYATTDGQWRFTERIVNVLWTSEHPVIVSW